MRALLAIALLIGLLWPVNALADITGKPRVIDGDTLEIAGERIRLHGIDAPETGQIPHNAPPIGHVRCAVVGVLGAFDN